MERVVDAVGLAHGRAVDEVVGRVAVSWDRLAGLDGRAVEDERAVDELDELYGCDDGDEFGLHDGCGGECERGDCFWGQCCECGECGDGDGGEWWRGFSEGYGVAGCGGSGCHGGACVGWGGGGGGDGGYRGFVKRVVRRWSGRWGRKEFRGLVLGKARIRRGFGSCIDIKEYWIAFIAGPHGRFGVRIHSFMTFFLDEVRCADLCT